MPTVTGIQLPGTVQAVTVGWGTNSVGLGMATCVSVGMRGGGNVGEGSGEANSTANVVGMEEGVGGEADVDDSVNASEMPPITSRREIAPTMKPLPNWRRAFILFLRPRYVRGDRQ